MNEERKDIPEENSKIEEQDTELTHAAEELQNRLEEAQAKASEYYDAWLRAKAETENIRRRLESEMENLKKFAIERFAAEIVAVKDSLEAALATENQTVEGFREGVGITLKQLVNVFQNFGLKEIFPEGEKFDPNVHQAIGIHPTADKEPNTIHHVLQKGYLLHDRLLRPALVTVAALPNKENEQKNSSTS